MSDLEKNDNVVWLFFKIVSEYDCINMKKTESSQLFINLY